MKLGLFFSILFLLFNQTASAQKGSIKGVVINQETTQPLADLNVGLEGTTKGAFTDAYGAFEIKNIEEGDYALIISGIGFKRFKKNIQISDTSVVQLNIQMIPVFNELEQVVITGTMREISVKDSPVKVNMVPKSFLGKSSAQNLMDALDYVNGLQNQSECAVCGTNSVRINGMDGPYTAVLIDGMPLMGSLASVYSLNGINPDIIKNIEIIKGPNSTLYGSQAMGGVINIVTVDPSDSPAISSRISSSTHSENDLNFSASKQFKKFSTLISTSYYSQSQFIDQNNDLFADITKDNRLSVFNKWKFNRKNDQDFNFAVKLYMEDRMGGTENYSHSIRGDNRIYGESIFTDRIEVLGNYEFLLGNEQFKFESSYSYHDQDSYYGDLSYVANQQTAFGNLIWDKRFSAERNLIMGSTFRYDILNQNFDDQNILGGSRDLRVIPGLFAQYDHIFSLKTRGLIGLRADHFNDHGIILSPRLNMKYDASKHTTFRFNIGTGFRVVNLFTEEHEALNGSRRVVLEEALDPEQSLNVTTNWNQIIDIGPSILNVDVDLFYTYFTNQILPIYDQDPNLIYYRNLDGFSVSQGISISAAHNFIAPLTYSIGFTVLDAYREEDGVRESVVYSPDFTSVFTLTYTFEKQNIVLDYTGRLLSRVRLPEYDGLSEYSPIFTEHNIKFTKSLSSGLSLFAAVNNVFNYTQQNPILSPDQPFGADFATDYVYGPIQGRRAIFGLSLKIN